MYKIYNLSSSQLCITNLNIISLDKIITSTNIFRPTCTRRRRLRLGSLTSSATTPPSPWSTSRTTRARPCCCPETRRQTQALGPEHLGVWPWVTMTIVTDNWLARSFKFCSEKKTIYFLVTFTTYLTSTLEITLWKDIINAKQSLNVTRFFCIYL